MPKIFGDWTVAIVVALGAIITAVLWFLKKTIAGLTAGWVLPTWAFTALAVLAIVVILIVLSRKKGWPKGATLKKIPVGKILGCALGAAAVLFIIFFLPSYILEWQKRVQEEGKVLAVTHAWSVPVEVPLGEMVLWDHRDNAEYEVRIQSGKVFRYKRDPEPDRRPACERHVWIDERVSSFQIRLVDQKVQETVFDIAHLPYRKGGPCDEIAPAQAEPSKTEPEVPNFFGPLRPKEPEAKQKREPRRL